MSSPATRRVVITGMGLISPLGHSPDELYAALLAGKSGVGTLESVPSEHLSTSVAGEAREFDGKIDQFGPLSKDRKKAIRKALKVMCRETQMGVAAAQLAVIDAGFEDGGMDPERTGVLFGSDYMLTQPEEFAAGIRKCRDDGKFNYSRWGDDGLDQMSPLWLLKYLPNMPASHIAIFNDLRGPNNSITHREAASNLAIGEAVHTIQRGSADRMLAGATGTRVHLMKTVHAVQTEHLASGNGDPAKASRPFDRDRTGMVIGEGAATIVLEELAVAKARGANIYAEVVSAASRVVLDRDGQAHRDAALAGAIQACLDRVSVSPADVGHIHAHGLSTPQCDAEEARAIRQVFGAEADRVPVVAAKANFGNLGAGSGIVELIASVKALSEGKLFPLLNYQTPDPECPIAAVTSADVSPGSSFLNLNTTPQAQAAVVLVSAFDD